MARIYKESRYVLQLLIGKSYNAQYDDVKISFYTKNPNNQVMVDNGITIKRNIAEVKIESTLFDNLEEGLISYIVYGTKDGIPFIEERQSNYFLKTPLDFKPGEGGSCNLENKSVTPSMGERNNDGYIIVEEDEGYDGLSRVVIDPQTLYNEGVNEQKSKLESISITENGTYTKEDGYNQIEVNVPDLNGSYNEGYGQGKTDGVNEQKGKLTQIRITENGTYAKEDGYSEVVVDVPDLNGSYDQGQADVAANARVLNVTENGSYVSKYTKEDEIVMPFDLWGDDFYSYAYVKNKIYNTGIIPNENTRLEFWFKPDEVDYTKESSIVIMNNTNSVYGSFFGIFHNTAGNSTYYANVGSDRVNFNLTNGVLYHIVLSVADGLVINGEQIGTFSSSSNFSEPLYINGMSNDLNASADGEFGMIKIDDTIIIPTKNGFLNQNTNELLEVVYDGGLYKFTEISKPTIEGNLYRTINVNVIPKINVKEAGIKFSKSTFTEVPEWADFEGITDMARMFSNCKNLQTIPMIDTSNAYTMNSMFANCDHLKTISLIDTSNVSDMQNMFKQCSDLQTIPQLNTSNATGMSYIFWSCYSLQAIPSLDTSKAVYMDNMFGSCDKLTSLPALNTQSLEMPSYYGFFHTSELPNITDFGGFLNLKCSLTDDDNLKRLPNLTRQSCINVLNGLYDFTGNGETPNSNQGKLKVHANFLTTVGDEISIGVAKGWTITA